MSKKRTVLQGSFSMVIGIMVLKLLTTRNKYVDLLGQEVLDNNLICYKHDESTFSIT